MQTSDLKEVTAIYQQGIDTKVATFELKAPSPEGWDQKFHPSLRFVYEEKDEILGWVSLTQVSSRPAYCGVGEVSIYLRPDASGRGIGTQLLCRLEQEAKKEGYWMLQSSIFELNRASIRLHEKSGFRLVGMRKKIARRDGIWHNTVLMEKSIIDNE